MRQYLDTLRFILANGNDRMDRTGIGTRACFGLRMHYNMRDGFPLLTTKKIAFEAVKAELLWFLSGSTNVYDLHQHNCHIWDLNAFAPHWVPHARFPGDAGRIYGAQWRGWQAPDGRVIDQIHHLINAIKTKPTDRGLVVAAWNPGELDQMSLRPCHAFFQFFVAKGELSLQMYQRSADMFLGVPFNIASYALLLHLVAQVTDLMPGEFIHVLGDAHIYHDHFKQTLMQLTRSPYSLPRLWLNPNVKDINSFKMEDIRLIDYRSHPAIKAPMAL